MLHYKACILFLCSAVIYSLLLIVLFFCLVTVEKAPGPSLFDQKASASAFDQQQQPVKVVYYRALYPFDARSHDEISITPGDVIMVCSLQKNLLSQLNSAKLTTVSDGHVQDVHTHVLLPVLYLFVFYSF